MASKSAHRTVANKNRTGTFIFDGQNTFDNSEFVGGNKTVYHGYTPDQLLDTLEKRGQLKSAYEIGLERGVIVKLARPLKPDLTESDVEGALRELEHAVKIAVGLLARADAKVAGGDDALVDSVLKEMARLTKAGDFSGGSAEADRAISALEAAAERDKKRMLALHKEAIIVDTLNRNAPKVADRIEEIIRLKHNETRPRWHPEYKDQWERFGLEEGDREAFGLTVSIELAKRMLATARNDEEKFLATRRLGIVRKWLGIVDRDDNLIEEAKYDFQRGLAFIAGKEHVRRRMLMREGAGECASRLGRARKDTRLCREAIHEFEAGLSEAAEGSFLEERRDLLVGGAKAWLICGELSDDVSDLQEGARWYRKAIAATDRNESPAHWINLQGELAHLLDRIGLRIEGAEHLHEAIAGWNLVLASLDPNEESSRNRYRHMLKASEALLRQRTNTTALDAPKGSWLGRWFGIRRAESALSKAQSDLIRDLQELLSKQDKVYDMNQIPAPLAKVKQVLRKRISLPPDLDNAPSIDEAVRLYLDLSRFIPDWDYLDCARVLLIAPPNNTLEKQIYRLKTCWGAEEVADWRKKQRPQLERELLKIRTETGATFAIPPPTPEGF